MAIDWTGSMQRTYEFYKVDPLSWLDLTPIRSVVSCTITRDSSYETCQSASITMTEDLGEFYIRIYMVAKQNGETTRVCLGTFLVQTPGKSYDGRYGNYECDAYSPLIELKGTYPPYGYTLAKNIPIMSTASSLTREWLRAPVISTTGEKSTTDWYVANTDDTWLSFLSDFIAQEDYYFGLDDKSRIMFVKTIETAKMQPKWTFSDDDNSIIMSSMKIDRDLYSVPNAVEIFSSTSGGTPLECRVENTNVSSPISLPNRGREVTYRATSPSIGGNPSQAQVDEYAKYMLSSLSSLEFTLTYSHAYCPVTVGDCVRINYTRAGLPNIKARITSQKITCDAACTVEETAVYTERLWE